MHVFRIALILMCLLSVAWTAPVQGEVLGPFCVQVGPPLNATFNLLVPVITPTQFQIVGSVFGDVPAYGSGLLNASNLSRFSVTTGARFVPPSTVIPPISLTGTLDPFNTSAPGTGICLGGGQDVCGFGATVTLQLVGGC